MSTTHQRSYGNPPEPRHHTHRPAERQFSCAELFAGCGGMATGLSQAGFHHVAMAEFNKQACSTLRHHFVEDTEQSSPSILEDDVRNIDWTALSNVDLVAGGPPCQPFSAGGLSAGKADHRDMWPEAIRAVRQMRPRAFLFENVKGLLRPSFAPYLASIVDALKRGGHPDAVPEAYEVAMIPVNAADYGAAQKRERVLIAGIRRDVGTLRPFPAPTHSAARLVWDKWMSGTYWQRHGLSRPGTIRHADRKLLSSLTESGHEPHVLPWQTCRDAFAGLGEPSPAGRLSGHEPRGFGKQYPGHTGSELDAPAKALKAGVHGVPGGENMVILDDGRARHFTVREAARLQGMPDAFLPTGSWSQAMRQLGNAVPAQLAEVAGSWIADMLS
ncbi:DNA cytosine methyltransferase [Paraburkholderia azotifigens]|uniref:Cytosine-specific methyltransferase n=1 Tax=Paraburkholderia azotifigens TaxID=2057004 RepID=A0A5C6V350_9BURK|nr:DNA cytosine methyltransferase [Paraburkholderia azotifigens]TXC79111.1 DNA cytosine methyltransferase [Paraburkholderia azotifigens]